MTRRGIEFCGSQTTRQINMTPLKGSARGYGMAAAMALCMTSGVVAEEPQGAAPGLPALLDINWRLGPDLPQGLQDSEVAIVNDTLISVAGFCSGEEGVVGKPDKYPRGFLKRVWGMVIDETAQTDWRELPDFPGDARQGLFGGVVNDRFYAWGGFSYSKPYCYRDGYRLSVTDGQWRWDRLPDLPWPIAGAGMAQSGSKLYVMGGAQYDLKQFNTNMSVDGKVKRLGARLLVYDTDHPDSGWRELSECPGTPRWVQAVTELDGYIYVIGGATGSDNEAGSYYTVVDNWRYDIAKDQWTRLADLPISSGNFPDGRIVFQDRYILLIGGYPYSKVQNPDGSLKEPYGKPYKHYPDVFTYSDIFVYDTATDTFGKATPMPLNNNLPTSIISGNRLYMIGGEIERAEIEGIHYGHHPDLLLIGDITIPDR
jgi:Galactose oxidase, central domain